MFITLKFWQGKNIYSNLLRNIDKEISKQDLPTLRNTYGRHKSFFSEIELPALAALSFYPELKNTQIRLVKANITMTMETQPATKQYFPYKF